MATPKTIRIAVAQAASIDFDLQGSVNKACQLIAEAGRAQAQLICFPEAFIPGYPFWIWYALFRPHVLRQSNTIIRSRGIDIALTKRYIKNSLRRDSPEMRRICQTAANNNIEVHLGYSENDNDSLYIAQSHIAFDGTIRMTRRKIKPTHVERTIFGEGSGSSLLNVVDVPGMGKVGGLNCWEHVQPLLKYHTHVQGEQIHVAAWPPMMPGQDGASFWNTTTEGKHPCIGQFEC